MKTLILCLAAPIAGIFAVCLWGPEPPVWLRQLEVLIFSAAGLSFGYTTLSPRAPAWCSTRAIKGAVCIWLGCGALFVPASFIVSALLIGIGCRLVMSEFRPGVTATIAPATAIRRAPGDLAPRASADLAARDPS